MAAKGGMRMYQFDVKTAYLYGPLDEEIYVVPPACYRPATPGAVWRLRRALYGLKQAGRQWNGELVRRFKDIGLQPCAADPCAFVYTGADSAVRAIVYADDGLLASADAQLAARILDELADAWDITHGDGEDYLGIRIQRDWDAGTVRIDQEAYARSVVAHFGADALPPLSLPMQPGLLLTKDGTPCDDAPRYPSLVGSLMHLANSTRPDIAYATSQLAKYMAAPTSTHWDAAMRLLRYVSGTAAAGITYGRSTGVLGYSDSDWARCQDTGRSVSGHVFLLHGGAVVWQSSTQRTVAVSTCEAEYQAAGEAVRAALWLRTLLPDLAVPLDGPTRILGENKAALELAKSPMISKRSKHIAVHHHFVRERAAMGEVEFVRCATADNVADCLTKPLGAQRGALCWQGMGMTGL